VTVETFVVFQTTVDLPCLPATFLIEYVGEFVEVALVEFDPALSAVGGVGFAP